MDPEFLSLVEETKALLRYAFRTENEVTFPISGPGSAGMEACFSNLVSENDTVVVAINGAFGERMANVAARCGGRVVRVDHDWGQAIDLDRVEEALRTHSEANTLCFVHAETSTGVLSDAKELCGLARKYGCETIMDAVTSLGGIDVSVDEWGADAVYAASQKCLSCVPGLAPVTFSERALGRIEQRESDSHSWIFDLRLLLGYWNGESERTYHHTAPVNSIYGLHEALLMLREEGLEHVWGRHRVNHEALAAGLTALGLSFQVTRASDRLPQMNAILVPRGVDESRVRARLLEEYRLEIAGGLGPFAGVSWRIGLMGNSARRRNVLHCLGALEEVLISMGAAPQAIVAVPAARAVFEKRGNIGCD